MLGRHKLDKYWLNTRGLEKWDFCPEFRANEAWIKLGAPSLIEKAPLWEKEKLKNRKKT